MSRNLQLPGAHFECAIIGAGPAGLSCALLLARHLRKVIVIDTGSPRNAASQRVNGLIGRHGTSPVELIERGRREAIDAGALFFSDRVDRLSLDGEEFLLSCAQKKFRASRVVLAYGIKDTMPDIAGAKELYGRGIFHCPTCDGYEVKAKNVVALGKGKKVASLGLELTHWAKGVTILTNGEDTQIDSEAARKLGENNVNIVTNPIDRCIARGKDFSGVQFIGGSTLEADALFFVLGTVRSAQFAEDMGCELDSETDTIRVNEQLETSVPGIYAIGDLIDGPQQVAKAAADGVVAAVAIHKSLLPENRLIS
jgi:thioredoxin reductase